MNWDYQDYSFELKRHLDFKEKLLWTGAPRKGIVLRRSDIIMIPFSLFWGGFAFFWEYTVISSGTSFLFAIWGIPFVLVGIYLIFGRFIYDSIRRRNIIYGLTQFRVIIKSGIKSKTIKSINLKSLTDVTLNEKLDGSGSVLFNTKFAISNMFKGTGESIAGSKDGPSFEMISDVRRVYNQIIEYQNKYKL